jgi:hypothetical protein
VNSDKRIATVTALLDKAGMLTSALCAVHCILLPILITMSAFSGLVIFSNPTAENIIFGVSVLLGSSSLFPSYFKHHRNLYPILVLLSGFFVIGLSRFTVNVDESVLVSLGAALVASAHFFNYRLCKAWHNKI